MNWAFSNPTHETGDRIRPHTPLTELTSISHGANAWISESLESQTSTASALPSASSGSEVQSCCEHQLRLFVTQIRVRVLTKCGVLEDPSLEEWDAFTEYRVKQTVEWPQAHRGSLTEYQTCQKDLQEGGEATKEGAEQVTGACGFSTGFSHQLCGHCAVLAESNRRPPGRTREEDPTSPAALLIPCFTTERYACDFWDGVIQIKVTSNVHVHVSADSGLFFFLFLNLGTTINPSGAFVDAAEVGEKKQTQITD